MKKLSIKDMAITAVITALMCIAGPLSIPIGPVPISLTNLVVYIAVIILGWKLGTLSYVIYLLLGLVGLPIFSGFQGGLSKLAGPTGGYLVGFILMAIVCGLFYEKNSNRYVITGIGFFLGTIIAYAFGTVWYVFMTKSAVLSALTVCVFPFIPFDVLKIVIAIALGVAVRTALRKARLIA